MEAPYGSPRGTLVEAPVEPPVEAPAEPSWKPLVEAPRGNPGTENPERKTRGNPGTENPAAPMKTDLVNPQ